MYNCTPRLSIDVSRLRQKYSNKATLANSKISVTESDQSAKPMLQHCSEQGSSKVQAVDDLTDASLESSACEGSTKEVCEEASVMPSHTEIHPTKEVSAENTIIPEKLIDLTSHSESDSKQQSTLLSFVETKRYF